MRYGMLPPRERDGMLDALRAMPEFLAERFGALPEEVANRPEPDGAFSPVEHCWHLADLEREGYAARIARLLAETEPALPDFDGGRIAAERQYRTRSLAAAIEAFREARRANLAAFARLAEADWSRAGQQEGVGKVSLCDLPAMMAEHDRTHREEIESWQRSRV
ncbi:MAG: DinB family protein [Vicinamibacteria bacterium]|nr:DinB family protein [Vicinamibacteria bacterium]